jgi:hypothetical protein
MIKESKSQRVKESKGQRVKESKSQRVKESKGALHVVLERVVIMSPHHQISNTFSSAHQNTSFY